MQHFAWDSNINRIVHVAFLVARDRLLATPDGLSFSRYDPLLENSLIKQSPPSKVY